MRRMTTIKCVWVLLILLLGQNVPTQEPQRRASNSWIQMPRLSAEEHKRMMDLPGIKSLRPGHNGMDSKAANYANYENPAGALEHFCYGLCL